MSEQATEWSLSKTVRDRRYRWFLPAYFLDEFCNAVWLVTLGWVIARTDSSWASAGILVATGVPLALVLLFLSGWVDRHKSRRVALITLSIRVLLMIAWAGIVASGTYPFVLVAVVGALVGAVSGLHEPAMTTYPTALLPTEGQAPGVFLERVEHRGSQMVGGVVAGALLAYGGLGAPAVVGAAAVLASLLILYRLSRVEVSDEAAAKDEGRTSGSENELSVREAVSFVRTHDLLGRTLVLQASITVAFSVVLSILLPFRARDEGWSAQQFGTLVSFLGVGSVVGVGLGFLLQRYDINHRVLWSCWMATAAGGVVTVLGVVDNYRADQVLLVLAGLALGPAGPFLSGYLRAEGAAEDKRRQGQASVSGRLMAVLILMTDAMEPVGFVAAIALAAVFSTGLPAVVAGLICVGAGLWAGSRARAITAASLPVRT